MTESTGPSRAAFLRGSAVAALTAVAGSSLASCASKDSLRAATGTLPPMPDFVPFDGPPPVHPATASGIPASYYTYPSSPVRAVAPPTGTGDPLRGLVSINWAPPTPRGQNLVWQDVERRLGRRVDLSIVSGPDYPAKLATVISTGDIPDLFQWTGITPYYLTFFQRECAELTPFVSGSAVRDYPALANLPTTGWRATTIGGGIWGVPNVRYATYGNGLYRKEMFDRVGPFPRTADDWARYLKELTRPRDNVYGTVTANANLFNMTTYRAMFGVPLNWRRAPDGSLTKDIETEEYLAAVEYVRKLYASGVFFPGSPGMTTLQMKSVFNSGQAATTFDTISAFPFATGLYAQSKQLDQAAQPRFIPRMHHAGGEGSSLLDGAILGYTVLRKGTPEQTAARLRAVDFFASPFGTEEYLVLKYGVRGVDHTLNELGNPVLTPRGQNDVNVPFRYLGDGPQTNYDPTSREPVDVLYEGLSDLLTRTVADPTLGLYSPTQTAVGSVLDQKVTDTVTEVVSGRASPQAFLDLRGWWRSHGGADIRNELQDALAQAGPAAAPGTPAAGPSSTGVAR